MTPKLFFRKTGVQKSSAAQNYKKEKAIILEFKPKK